jgi:acetyltransferase
VPDIKSSSKASARAVLEKALKNAERRRRRSRPKNAHSLRHSVSAKRSQTAAEAVKIAKKIGFPVVASGQRRHPAQVRHRRRGANLNSAAEVKKAFNDITARVKKIKSKPRLEGILIAQQVKRRSRTGCRRIADAEMGPVVLFGTGGVDIELMKDARYGAPLDEAEARQLIGKTKAGVKMKGYRGKPVLHEASAVKALVGLSNLMADAATASRRSTSIRS